MGKTIDQVIPIPMLNILNGGEHADNNIDIQEFMIIPGRAVNFRKLYGGLLRYIGILNLFLKKRPINCWVMKGGLLQISTQIEKLLI